MVRYFSIGLLLLVCVHLNAQNIDAFATAEVNNNKVVVEQPVKVTIKAYASTWFAQPLSFQNLQVNGAYVQAFKRTVPSIEYVNNKKYAALTFYYVLFPYTSGEVIFPELTLSTSIPPENDFKGQPVSLKTKPIIIMVDPPPADADERHWLVASNATIRNEWSADLSSVKVGDVVTRKIVINASGTLPSFIDEPIIEDIDFGSIYTSEPQFFDKRDDKTVNGQRVDFYSYLLEDEGEFTVPEVEITWWNPYAGRYYKRKLPEYNIRVSENPGMLSLQQLKDSLMALNPPVIPDSENAEKTGNWRMYLLLAGKLVLILIILLSLLYVTRKRLLRLREKRKRYLNSEEYLFNSLIKQHDSKKWLLAYYKWLNITDSDMDLDNEEFAAFSQDLNLIKAQYFNSQAASPTFSLSKTSNKLKRARKTYSKQRRKPGMKYRLKGLNP